MAVPCRPRIVTPASRAGLRRNFSSATPRPASLPTISLHEHIIGQAKGAEDPLKYPSLDLGWGRIYGGQLIAQAIDAAQRLHPEKKCNSIRTRFLASGDVKMPVIHDTRSIRNGKSFAWEAIQSKQVHSPNVLASSIVSFQAPSTKIKTWHDDSRRLNASIIDDLTPPERSERVKAWVIGFDIRDCWRKSDGTQMSTKRDTVRPVWLRRAPQNEQQRWTEKEDQVALGYVSDYYFLRAALELHDLWVFDPNVRAASLCHSIFYHRPLDLSQWHLFLARAPTAHGGRALVEGEFLNQKGERVATVFQEGLIWQRDVKAKDMIISMLPTALSIKHSSPELPFKVNPQSELQKWLATPASPAGEGTAECKEFGWGRIYGGQLLGQALLTAAAKAKSGRRALTTNETELFLHSFHSHFVQAGKTRQEASFTSRVERAGQVYTVVSVRASQQPVGTIFRADASFASVEPSSQQKGQGVDHDEFLMNADECRKAFEALGPDTEKGKAEKEYSMPFAYRQNAMKKLGMDFRADFDFKNDSFQRVFLRSEHRVDSLTMNQALLAYAMDCLFPATATLRHGEQLNIWTGKSVACASLCSSIYFHRPFSMCDDWLILRSSCPVLTDERAFVKVDVFRAWGRERVATAIQEVLVRVNK